MELEDIEREKINGSLTKRQICQYFPLLINCAVRYTAKEPVRITACISKSKVEYVLSRLCECALGGRAETIKTC